MGDGITETLGLDTAGFGSAIAGIGSGLFSFVIFLALVAVVLYFVWYFSFNQTITIKKVVNNGLKRRTRKCKTVMKSGASFLQIRVPNPFAKIYHPSPPLGIIEVDNRGREHITAYETATGEIVYAQDKGKIPEIPQHLSSIEDAWERKTQIDKWKKENNVVEAFMPISANQRNFYISQIRQANDKVKKTVLDTIRDMAPIMAIVIMFAIMLIFGGKLYEPATQLADKVVEHDKLVLKLAEKIEDIDRNVQRIVNEDREDIDTPPG